MGGTLLFCATVVAEEVEVSGGEGRANWIERLLPF